MICKNCGTECSEGARFCRGCGQPFEVAETVNSAEQANTAETVDSAEQTNATEAPVVENNWAQNSVNMNMPKASNAGMNQLLDKLKGIPKAVIAGACAAVVLLIAIICIAVNAGKTINLNKYLVIEANGYDGYGTARATIDWDAIEEKYGNKISFTKDVKEKYGSLLSMMTPADVLSDFISVKLVNNSNLKNGDKVEYTWTINENISKYIKCKVKSKDSSYTVEGLTDVGTFDAFANLEVKFSGIAPNGKVSINYNGSDLNTYDFTCDKTNGLKNDDVVKITIDQSRVESYAKNLGKVPATLEKEYKVEGLNSYISALSQLSDDGLASMQKQATDVYNAYVAKNWGEGQNLESLTYLGNYLLTSKNNSSTNNILYLVYKAQIKNTYSNNGETYDKVSDVYWYISYSNIMITSDGKVTVDLTSYNTARGTVKIDSGISSGWWSTKTWSYYGYSTLAELYKVAVTSRIDTYIHEDNVKESIAPETATNAVPAV